MSSTGAHDSRGRAVFIVTTTTFVLASVFVAARLVSRFGVLRSRTADDWCMILAWLIAFGLSFAIDYGTSKGLGKHDVDIQDGWIPSLRGSEFAFTILYNPALMATKTSILIFYLRMSKNTQILLRIASYITLAVVNISGVVLTFLNAFQCNPPSAAYDPLEKNDTCISIVTLYLCSAPVNIITDLAILVLPIPVLTGMRLPQRQKTILVITFGLGIFVTIVDVVRVYYLQQAVTDQQINSAHLGTEQDFAWNASTAFMWSAVEVNIGIICACIPTLKPLIKLILPAMIRGSGDGSLTEKDSSVSEHLQPDVPQPHRPESIADPEPLSPVHMQDQEYQMDMMDFLTTPGDRPPGTGPAQQRMDMMDFLTTPGDIAPGTLQRNRTATTHATQNSVYFGFVSMKRPKSMLKTKGWESFKYCALVTTLFFLWGFSYGLLNTLNNQIAIIANQSTAQALGLTTAYFGAYGVGALTVGQYVLRHAGFKATFISGLCIYGTGTLMFWPSAVLKSYPGFIISNFVVGFGLAVLETAANPFLALCGPSRFAEFRLLLAQAIQAVASTLSQVLAEKVLFDGISSLIDVQWTYLAITLFTVMLALFFYYMPLPEASDAELIIQAQSLDIHPHQSVSRRITLPIIYTTLSLAIMAQFIYVAAQESMSVWFGVLLASRPNLTLTLDDYGLLSHATFAAGRFLFAPLCLFIPPRILLLLAFLCAILFAILTMSLSGEAATIAGPGLVFLFFEGPIFPLVYAIGLRGLGKRTKVGAAGLTGACAGGGIFPFVMFAVQRLDHRSIEYSYCVIVALFAIGTLFPVYLNVMPRARWWVDPRVEEARLGDEVDVDEGRPGGTRRESGSFDSIRRFSRRFSHVFFEKIRGPKGSGNVDSGDGTGAGAQVEVEHRERKTAS